MLKEDQIFVAASQQKPHPLGNGAKLEPRPIDLGDKVHARRVALLAVVSVHKRPQAGKCAVVDDQDVVRRVETADGRDHGRDRRVEEQEVADLVLVVGVTDVERRRDARANHKQEGGGDAVIRRVHLMATPMAQVHEEVSMADAEAARAERLRALGFDYQSELSRVTSVKQPVKQPPPPEWLAEADAARRYELWLEEGGARCDAVNVVPAGDAERFALVTSGAVAEGSTLFEVPASMLLTADVALRDRTRRP